jgi:hypothetical protein
VHHAPPQFVDVLNALADQDGSEELNDGRDDFGAEVAGVGLADPGQPRVGMDFDKGGRTQAARFAQKAVVGGRQVSSVVVTAVIFIASPRIGRGAWRGTLRRPRR